jgi:hypothetical protein
LLYYLDSPYEISKIGPESHVSGTKSIVSPHPLFRTAVLPIEGSYHYSRRRGFLQSPFLYRQAFEKDEALAIENLPPDRAEESFKSGQWEMFLLIKKGIGRSA